jgi:hypothetical protein
MGDRPIQPPNTLGYRSACRHRSRWTLSKSEGPDIEIAGDPSSLREIVGAGAPTDGTTGANTAGPGSRYTDVTGAKLYINGGTRASPAWKIVTSA